MEISETAEVLMIFSTERSPTMKERTEKKIIFSFLYRHRKNPIKAIPPMPMATLQVTRFVVA